MSTKKYPGFIIGCTNEFFKNNPAFGQGLTTYSYNKFLEEVQSSIVIREREHMEKDPTYRQFLPYIIVQRIGEDGVLRYKPYRRVGKTGEVRLAGNVSIGYGGHVDLSDVKYDDGSVIFLGNTFVSCAARELAEEVRVTPGQIDDVDTSLFDFANMFILDDTNEVGKVHVGIIAVCQVHTDAHFDVAEDELTFMPEMTREELLASGLPLENWTRIYLEHASLAGDYNLVQETAEATME